MRQSFVHLADVVNAFECAVQHANDLPSEVSFLVGEPEGLSYAEIQNEIGRLLYNKDWITVSIPKVNAKIGAYLESALPVPEKPFIKPWMIDRANDNYELSIDKARKLLGWEPQHSLREVIPKMITALKTDPTKWYKVNKLQLPERYERKKQKEEQT